MSLGRISGARITRRGAAFGPALPIFFVAVLMTVGAFLSGCGKATPESVPSTPGSPPLPTASRPQFSPAQGDRGEGNPVGKDPDAPEKLPGCFTPEPTVEQVAQYKRVFLEAVEKKQSLTPLFAISSTAPEMAAALELKPTDVVADVGAGTGPFEIMLLEKGYPFARLYAVDIAAAALDFFRFLLENSGLPGKERIVPVLSTMNNITLAPESTDVLFLLNTPIFMGDPETKKANRCLQSIVVALKSGGRFHIFHEKMPHFPPEFPETVVRTFDLLGLRSFKVEVIEIGDTLRRPFYHWEFRKP